MVMEGPSSRSRSSIGVGCFYDSLRTVVAIVALGPLALASFASAGSDELKIESMLPFEGDTKISVSLTVRECVGRIFTATIESSYLPINYSGRAIVLGHLDCSQTNWGLAGFSPLYMENVLFLQDNSKVVPGWNLQAQNRDPVLSYCQPGLSSCRIFQFERSAEGWLVGAKMLYVEEEALLRSTGFDVLLSMPENLREHYQFERLVEVGHRKLFAAVGRVIVFDDGSCELLGPETRSVIELKVLESCSK